MKTFFTEENKARFNPTFPPPPLSKEPDAPPRGNLAASLELPKAQLGPRAAVTRPHPGHTHFPPQAARGENKSPRRPGPAAAGRRWGGWRGSSCRCYKAGAGGAGPQSEPQPSPSHTLFLAAEGSRSVPRCAKGWPRCPTPAWRGETAVRDGWDGMGLLGGMLRVAWSW